jgi:RNA polymerase sigma-70 factor, ECF subfamily
MDEISRRLVLESLFAEHAPAVRAYGLRRTDPASADDIISEVFVVAWRRLDDLPREAALPWLLGCARRLLPNQRRGGRTRALALRDRLAGEPARDGLFSPDLGLAEALMRLREADRELLMLIAWEGLSPAEAARVLGCSPAAAAMRLSRARRRLARALSGQKHAESNPPATMEAE